MGEIDFTNIIIDDFRKGKQNPFNRYIYILTHIHSDHLKGLSNSWDYGPIYCSQITANLILNKFPNLVHCVKILPLEQQYKITLSQNITATITLFDANHCAGSVMVLLQGYFGKFLYTGDCRFDRNKFSSYSYLYPPQNQNDNFQGCSRKIDKMWMDNTFCNPKFGFLKQKQALELVTSFVRQTQERIYIGMDYYGKQQVLIHLAKQLQMIIVVDQQRYETIMVMQLDRELFTTNPEQGRVQVVQKTKLHDKLIENPSAVGLVMSGWCIQKQWKKVRGTDQLRIFYIPYSLHSNYEEIVDFVRSIKPSILQPIVHYKDQLTGNISSQQMYNTEGNTQTFQLLATKYCSPISVVYKKNLMDKQFQRTLKKRLRLDLKSSEINKKQLGLETIFVPPRGRGGYRINQERNQEEIKKVKESYLRCKQGRGRDKSIVIDQSDCYDSDIEVIDRKTKKWQSDWQKKSEKNRTYSRNLKSQQEDKQPLMKVEVTQINKLHIVNIEEIKQLLRTQVRQLILSLK